MLTLLSSISTYLRPLAYIAAAVTLVFGGWMFNGYRWEAKWADFTAAAQQASAAEIQKARTVETVWRDLADMAASDLRGDYEDIQKKYEVALSRISALSDDLDRLHSERADSAGTVPTASQPTAGACKPCSCQSHRADAKSIAEALTIAKDCDRLAVRYNRLLELYNSVRQK